MHPALRSLRDEISATLVRLAAYVAGLAVLAMAVARLFDVAEVRAAIEPTARPDWITVERPYRAFALNSPHLPEPDYAIRRHAAGGRKDILTAADDVLRLVIEIYRPGREIARFGTPAEEAAATAAAWGSGIHTLRPADGLDGKFGRVTLFEFSARDGDKPRSCLAFVRSLDEPRLQIAGVYCRGEIEVVERRTLACAIEGLSLVAAASDPAVQALFAAAEQRRSFCAPRTAPRGVNLRRHDWIEGPHRPALRRSVATR